jgi:hypothetical protein
LIETHASSAPARRWDAFKKAGWGDAVAYFSRKPDSIERSGKIAADIFFLRLLFAVPPFFIILPETVAIATQALAARTGLNRGVMTLRRLII